MISVEITNKETRRIEEELEDGNLNCISSRTIDGHQEDGDKGLNKASIKR